LPDLGKDFLPPDETPQILLDGRFIAWQYTLHCKVSFMAKQLVPSAESESSERWEAQLRKGCLEMAVLVSLWNVSLYGLEILRVLERDSSLVLAEGTIYPILNRLRAEGLLESRWVEADAGHPRKYYELTPGGRARALQMAETWTQFSAGLGRLIEAVRGNNNGNGNNDVETL
jgi:PadR family transcriptional regulator PadR